MKSSGASEIGVFETIPIGRIKNSRKAVRDSLGEIDELVASVRENGLLEPLVVRPRGEYYEVVAGNRRLAACKKLRKKVVACHIVAMDDATSYEESLVENIQRRMMNPLEEAVAFKRYVDDYGFGGISQLARNIGKSQSYVSRRVALLDLPEGVRRGVSEGKLSSVVAQELIPLSKPEMSAMAELTVQAGLSRDDLRSMIRATKRGPVGDTDERLGFGPHVGPNNARVERVLNKAMTTMRVCLIRTDDMIDSLSDEDWLAKEALLGCRREMHSMLDRMIKLKVRSRKLGGGWPASTERPHHIVHRASKGRA